MKAPSAVSSSDIPAAKSSGSDSAARNGVSCVATPAAIASRPISLAVSKPSPNRRPSGYIFQELSTSRTGRPATRVSAPRWRKRRSIRSLSRRRNIRITSTSTIRFSAPPRDGSRSSGSGCSPTASHRRTMGAQLRAVGSGRGYSARLVISGNSAASAVQKTPPLRERYSRLRAANRIVSGSSAATATARPRGRPRPASRQVVPAS